MLVLPACRGVFGFWVFLVFAAYNCRGENDTVQVVGGVECADCGQNNIKTSQAFKGLRVTIHCKSGNGKLKTRGAGEVDQEGTFRATLPDYKIAKDGAEELKEDCFARLHGAGGAPCAVQNDQKDSKVVLKSKNANGEHVLGLINGSLKISRTTCPSAFLWLFPFPNFPFYHFPPPRPPQPEASPPPPSAAPVPNDVPPPAAPEYNNPPPAEASPPPQPQPPAHHHHHRVLVPPPPSTPVHDDVPPPAAPEYNNPPPAEASPPPQPRPLPPPPLYKNPSPPPLPVYNQPPPTPSPAYKNPTPQPSAPSPDYGQFIPPPSPVIDKPLPHLASPGKSFPRIPKAPPIPQLPRTPTTPRKFFNKPFPPSPSRA